MNWGNLLQLQNDVAKNLGSTPYPKVPILSYDYIDIPANLLSYL